jgi:hypothetical protein
VARPPLRPVHVALTALLAALSAAVLWPGRQHREDRGDVLAALKASRGPTLPEPRRAGAASTTALVRVDRETLSDVIDGAAEAYLSRGFTSAVFATYAFGAAPPTVEVAAEVHRFESEAGAAAQLEAERPRRGAAVSGLEGAVADGSVLLWRVGRDLLKLTLVTPGSGGADALAAVAGAWKRERP